MGKAARMRETERRLKIVRLRQKDPRRFRMLGGMRLCDTVRGTARQKKLMLMGDEVLRAAVRDFGTRRQKRALQRASAALERAGKFVQTEEPTRTSPLAG